MNGKLCKVCLDTGLLAHRCSLGIKCKKKDGGSTSHNTLLHPSESHADIENVKGNCSKPNDVSEAKTLATLSQPAIAGHKRSVYLDIVPVKIVAGDTAVHTYALLDSGSDKTFCERRLADELSLRASPVKLAVQTMTPGNPHVLNTVVVSFNLSSLSNSYSTKLSEVVVVDSIPVAPLVAPPNTELSKYPHLRDISFSPIDGDSATVLIGNDCVAAHRCLESRFSPDPENSPDAVLTPFSWNLRGFCFEHLQFNKKTSSSFLVRGFEWPTDAQCLDDIILIDEGDFFSGHPGSELCDPEELMSMLRDHKEMLEFGFKYSMEDPIAYKIMCRKLQYRDGHYQLPLLWRNDAVKLPQSRSVALKRLDSIKRRLEKDFILHSRYSEQMQAMIDCGYAERVPDHELQTPPRQWYIPHQPVLSAKKPNEVRVVHDCASIPGDKSLNNFLMKGPDLMNSLVGVLLRFRKAPIAVTADIETMFYQVRVAPSDKDALRFYWWPNGDLDRIPEICRMTVHLFGARSSPICATFCLRQTAKKFGKHFNPCVAAIVLNNFYVDDCLFSVENEEVAISIVNNLRSSKARLHIGEPTRRFLFLCAGFSDSQEFQ